MWVFVDVGWRGRPTRSVMVVGCLMLVMVEECFGSLDVEIEGRRREGTSWKAEEVLETVCKEEDMSGRHMREERVYCQKWERDITKEK